jgi:streptogrisin D
MSLSRLRRLRTGRARLAVMALVGALAAALAIPTAQAAPTAQVAAPTGWNATVIDAVSRDLGISKQEATRRATVQDRLTSVSAQLQSSLGARMAGSRIDWASGQLVVSVADQAAAAQARAAGAQARLITADRKRLDAAKASLDRAGGAPGLAWAVDAESGTLNVSVPAGAASASTAKFLAKARATGVKVKVEQVAGAVETQVFRGGEAIRTPSGSRCTSAFNTRSGSGTIYTLTAGHCTNISSSWLAQGTTLGTRAASSFPGDDFGAIRVTNLALNPVGEVLNRGAALDIVGSSQVPVGSSVCKTGSTTGTTCGVVQQYNVTVNYPQGTVRQLTRTNVCTQPGDSGGPLFAGNRAQAIVSGGTTGGCSGNFFSVFQPVPEALSRLGLTLM